MLPAAAFGECAKKLCKKFVQHMRVNGERWSAALFITGSLEQIGFGTWNLLHPHGISRVLLAGVFNTVASAGLLKYGRKDLALRICTSLGEIGTTLTLWPGLAAGDKNTIVAYSIATGVKTIHFFSPELTTTFEQSRYPILRHTLGSPRRTALVSIPNDLSVIFAHGLHHVVPEIAVPFSTWIAACLAGSMSKSERSKTRQSQPKPS